MAVPPWYSSICSKVEWDIWRLQGGYELAILVRGDTLLLGGLNSESQLEHSHGQNS